MVRLFLMMSVLFLTACGGSGGDDGQGPPVDPIVSGNVSITPPDQDTWGQRGFFTRTSSGTYETELSSTIFNGGVSFVDSADCNEHPGFHVTLSNAATNETVNASERVSCELIFRVGRWQSGRMALELGSNRITAFGADATATITVVRVAKPPTVAPSFPADGSIDVPLPISELRVVFSEDMNRTSINSANFILEDSSGVPVPGNVRSFSTYFSNFAPNAAGFTPREPLRFATTYTARITTGVTDVHGISLANEFS